MQKRLFDFSDVHLYVITSSPRAGQSYAAMVEAACAGGADAVQLRDKTLSSRELFRLAKDLQAICDRTGTFFILNDRVDVALAADVDGVHVGQEDLPVRMVRGMMGHKKLIGCSTHSTAQALAAVGDGADYISCGPLFATPTKPDYSAVGLELVKEYRQLVRIPFVAIGGLNLSNVTQAISAGADRVAVVRAIAGAPDVKRAAKDFKDLILKTKKERQETMASRRPNS
ncbi:MAG: thiamine phosphate synthase [Elusimicrobia bacterium]|jgi:thiamine-phosphate diphosphorylase|nr:thiamine phosphate synthase [Elusimicrobiota bacterium]